MDSFGKGPWIAHPDGNFQPCYECGRESRADWGWIVSDSQGNQVLEGLSEAQADAIATLFNNAL